MKTPFTVKTLNSPNFKAVSFSLDATRPEEYYVRLESSLAKMNVEGDVLLDLLACNGTSARRFFAVTFDGKKLRLETMRAQPLDRVDGVVLTACKEFYSKKPLKLASSVLSPMARRTFTAA
jgi:hypothetical protein